MLLVHLDAGEAGEVEQVFHQVAHAAGGVVDAVAGTGALLIQLAGMEIEQRRLKPAMRLSGPRRSCEAE